MKDTAVQNDLIFDVGMHRGEDSWIYLNKGFRVVAFEADPDLVQKCKEQFPDELASGQLTIVEGAIIEDTSQKTVTFFKNPVATIWGTVNADWAARNERMGWESVEITVPVVDFVKAIEEYGVPHYLKIDIEGADTVCLDSLRHFQNKPNYLSIESSKTSIEEIDNELKILTDLGYDAFKAVQQATHNKKPLPNPPLEGTKQVDFIPQDSSGLFGRELQGEWKDLKGIRKEYEKIMWGYKTFGNDTFMRTNPLARPVWKALQKIMGRPIPGWYDTHAKQSGYSE